MNDDKIEVGSVRHLAAAQLAQRQHRAGRAFHHAVPPRHLPPAARQHVRQSRLRQRRVGLFRLRHACRLRQQPRADDEFLLGDEDARPVQQLLERCIEGRKALQRFRQRVAPRQRPGERPLDERLEQPRALRQLRRQHRRAAQDQQQQLQQVRIGLQQREQLQPRRQPAHEAVKRRQRRLRLAAFRHLPQQRRQQRLQPPPRRRGTQRRHPPAEPAADDLRRRPGVGKAQPRQPVERLLRRLLRQQRVDERCLLRFLSGLRRLAEQRIIVPLHRFQRAPHRPPQRRRVGKSGKAGKALQLPFLARQRVRLQVGHHLQPMLPGAQPHVGRAQLFRRRLRDPAMRGQRLQHVQRAPPAQRRVAPAGDELLRLHEELYLADAAAPQFQVVPGHLDVAVALHRVDAPLHRVHVGNGRIVQILAPYPRRQLLHEALAQRHVAAAGPRLDPRRPLPRLADAEIVVQRHLHWQRHRRGAGVGPQPQVDAHHLPVLGDVGQDVDQPPHQPDEHRAGIAPRRHRRPRWLEQEDEVNIGGVVQLPRAALAHLEGHQPAARRVVIAQLPLLARLPQQEGQRRADGRIGKRGEPLRYLFKRPCPRQVGQRHQQRRPPPHQPQLAHQLLLRGQGGGLIHLRNDAGEQGG